MIGRDRQSDQQTGDTPAASGRGAGREVSLIALAAVVGAIAGLVVTAMGTGVDVLHRLLFQLEPGVRLSGLRLGSRPATRDFPAAWRLASAWPFGCGGPTFACWSVAVRSAVSPAPSARRWPAPSTGSRLIIDVHLEPPAALIPRRRRPFQGGWSRRRKLDVASGRSMGHVWTVPAV